MPHSHMCPSSQVYNIQHLKLPITSNNQRELSSGYDICFTFTIVNAQKVPGSIPGFRTLLFASYASKQSLRLSPRQGSIDNFCSTQLIAIYYRPFTSMSILCKRIYAPCIVKSLAHHRISRRLSQQVLSSHPLCYVGLSNRLYVPSLDQQEETSQAMIMRPTALNARARTG
jgi:hypothetical protein